MPTKEERRDEAAKHIGFLKTVFEKETQACVDAVIIYEEGDGRELEIPEPAAEHTEVEVTTDFTVTALYKQHGKAAVVDPAAFTKPGGNYEEGSFGPEQALCAESNLYLVLQGMRKQYYDKNRDFWRGQLFTDRAMFLPDIMFTRQGATLKAAVIAVAAPHRAHALENHRSERECDNAIANRIETILRIAAANGIEVLVCNAFGLGPFGNDPDQVIGLFKKWIDEHDGVLKRVVFAVPRDFKEPFENVFGKPEEPVVFVVSTDEDEEDEEDRFTIDPDDLPEGVTFRQ